MDDALHSAYLATSAMLGALTTEELGLRERLQESIDALPVKVDYVRCFHCSDFEGAFSIVASGLRPSGEVNLQQLRLNFAAGAFVSRLSPLDFGFPADGWLERLLNNNYGVAVESRSSQPATAWVQSRGQVCVVVDIPEAVLKDARKYSSDYAQEGRNVFFIPKSIFDAFGQKVLPRENIAFAFLTTLEKPPRGVAARLGKCLRTALSKKGLFEARWLLELGAPLPKRERTVLHGELESLSSLSQWRRPVETELQRQVERLQKEKRALELQVARLGSENRKLRNSPEAAEQKAATPEKKKPDAKAAKATKAVEKAIQAEEVAAQKRFEEGAAEKATQGKPQGKANAGVHAKLKRSAATEKAAAPKLLEEEAVEKATTQGQANAVVRADLKDAVAEVEVRVQAEKATQGQTKAAAAAKLEGVADTNLPEELARNTATHGKSDSTAHVKPKGAVVKAEVTCRDTAEEQAEESKTNTTTHGEHRGEAAKGEQLITREMSEDRAVAEKVAKGKSDVVACVVLQGEDSEGEVMAQKPPDEKAARKASEVKASATAGGELKGKVAHSENKAVEKAAEGRADVMASAELKDEVAKGEVATQKLCENKAAGKAAGCKANATARAELKGKVAKGEVTAGEMSEDEAAEMVGGKAKAVACSELKGEVAKAEVATLKLSQNKSAKKVPKAMATIEIAAKAVDELKG